MNSAMPVTSDHIVAEPDGSRRRTAPALDVTFPYPAERTRYSRGKRPGIVAVAMEVLLAIGVVLGFLWVKTSPDAPKRPSTMVVELLPLPSAPPVPPQPAPPGPKQEKTEEAQKQVVEKKQELPIPIIRMPVPEVAAAPKPEPRPQPVRPPQQRVDQTTAPAALPLPPKQAAGAPVLGAPTVSDQVAQQTWQDKVLARLEKMKRYPAEAQSAGQQDMVFVTVTIDRAGRVLGRKIRRSQQFASLDAEVMALVMRASPLPAPPASVSDADLTFDVPIQFMMSGTRNRRR